MRILVVADPMDALELDGDSTYAMMLEAARRGWEVWTCQIGHLSLEHEDAVASARQTTVREGATSAEAFMFAEPLSIPLDAFDAVLMRKDPPVDVAYLHATWLLDRARGKTVLVNDPRGLRELNEHLSILRFPELIPPTVVTRDPARVQAFLEEQGGAIIVKPVDGYGGRGIFVLRTGDPNLSSMIETSTNNGTDWTQAQRFLPAAAEGDKRILLVNGDPIGAVLRVPPKDEARGNLHVGGSAHKTQLSSDDKRIIRTIKPTLLEFGIMFAGIDVIGGRLTEINITSPTGIRHVDKLEGGNCASVLMSAIAAQVAAGSAL